MQTFLVVLLCISVSVFLSDPTTQNMSLCLIHCMNNNRNNKKLWEEFTASVFFQAFHCMAKLAIILPTLHLAASNTQHGLRCTQHRAQASVGTSLVVSKKLRETRNCVLELLASSDELQQISHGKTSWPCQRCDYCRRLLL